MDCRIDLQVERWPITRLIPRVTNPRTHSQEQVAQIAASMQEWGWTNPILVGADNIVIAGHGRLLAARKLAMTEVPVIVLTNLTEAQRRALVIADNQLAITGAGWDAEMLRLELAALNEENFDLNLIGFDDADLARLLADQDGTEGLTDEDAVPELPQTPVSLSGDLWNLGGHKLLVGDSTDRSQVARLMGGQAADLLFIDAPYNVDYQGYTEEHLTMQGDRMSDGDFKKFLEAAFRSCRAVAKLRRLAVRLPFVLLAAENSRFILTCKTGGFQGIKDRRSNDLQMFGPRFIRVVSGQEQERKPAFTSIEIASSPRHLHESESAQPSGGRAAGRSYLRPDLALISGCALNHKSNCCNEC